MSYQLVLAPASDPQSGGPPADHQYQVPATPVVATPATPVGVVNKDEIIFVQVTGNFASLSLVSQNSIVSQANASIVM